MSDQGENIEVDILFLPIGAEPRTKTLFVPQNTTVEEAIKQAGLSVENLDMNIDGNPVNGNHMIASSVLLEASEKARTTVTATERPQGS